MAQNEKQINTVFRVMLLTLAGCFIYAMSSGIRNNYGIMINPIVEHAGISFTTVSFILAVGQFTFGLVQPAFGIMAAKKGYLPVLVLGIVLTIAGMVLTPLSTSTFTLMLCLGFLVPAGTGATSYGIIIGTLAPKIPASSTHNVSGIINASSGIGNTVLAPITNFLIRSGGLMHSMLVLSIPMALMLPVSYWLGRKPKEKLALAVAIPQTPAQTQKVNIKALVQKAVVSRTYIYLMIGFFTCGFHMAIITNHLPTQIQSFGFSSSDAAYAFSIYGLTTIIGSVLSGYLCNRFKMKNVLGFYYGLRPITIALFLLLPKTLLNATIFTALFGFSGAATVSPVVGIIGKNYGYESVAVLFGLVFVVHQIGGFFGAWFGGICFDLIGSYNLIWLASLAFSTVASAVSYLIKE